MPETKTFDDLPPILSTEQAAELLQVTDQTLKRWARAGKLPGAFKLPGAKEWRVKRDELLAWMNQGGAK